MQNLIGFKRKRKLYRYFIWSVQVWVVLTLFLGYQYTLYSSDSEASKGGTIVEGVFDKISYLPYRSTNINDYFYQDILFPSCKTYVSIDGKISLQDDLCIISTNDNKTYEIQINTGYYRSDGNEMKIDDVFFTYNKILKNNIRQIPTLDIYGNIEVTQPNAQVIRVVFPFTSVDNNIFFTNFILPSHVLENATLKQYTEDFAILPVTDTCGQLEQTNDDTSLLFNVKNCDTSYLAYYQIKYFSDFNDFTTYKNDAEQSNQDNIIDIYTHNQRQNDYKQHDLLTSRYMTIFFNTKSNKFSDRIQRALAGLIYNNIYTGKVLPQINKNNKMLDVFLSTGDSLETYIYTHNPTLDFDKKDFENINISLIPNVVEISGTKQKKVFYLDTIPDSEFSVQLTFTGNSRSYDAITISSQQGTGNSTGLNNDIRTIIPKNNIYSFVLASGNIKEGLNKYVVSGKYSERNNQTNRSEQKSENIADLDIYYLNIPSSISGTIMSPERRYRVVYVKDDASNAIIYELQNLFERINIDNLFIFIGFDTVNDFKSRIDTKEYDIAIRPLDFGLRTDISNIFLTNEPNINPSQYINERLASLINTYINEKDETQKAKTKGEIDALYGNEAPFVILGQIKENIFIKQSIDFGYLNNNNTQYTLKKYFFNNVQLFSHISPNFDKIFSGGNMQSFFFHYLYPSQGQANTQ